MRKIMALAAFGCLATASFAQSTDQILLGVTAGWYLPTGSALRDAFGSQIFTIGFTPVATGRPSSGSITPSFNIIGASKDGSNFLLIPVTLGYEYHFGSDDANATTVPYARLEGGISYYNFSIDEGGPTNVEGNSRFGWVGAAELGISLNKTIKLNASYYLFEKESGIDFSGIQLGVTFGFIRL
jgi:hypothetical protein